MANITFYSNPGQSGGNHCPHHPSEPVVGMCGCGTFFCRLCSPSDIFCSRCLGERTQRYRLGHASAATIYSVDGLAAANTPLRAQKNSPRVIIEALLLTVLATVVIALVMGRGDQGLSLIMADTGLSASQSTKVVFGVNTESDPVQRETGFFEMALPLDAGTATVSGNASYSISAKVEGIKAYNDASSSAVPYDLLLTWGKLADSDVDSKLTWKQENRQGMVYGNLGGSTSPGIDKNYVINHMSNNHVIPANERIRAALQTVRPGDLVKIDGRLVDVQIRSGNRRISLQTSKSRSDQGDGACEVILVEHLKVNGKRYK